MTAPDKPLIGQCHCGRVAFHVVRRPERAVRCNCSYCWRRGWYTGYAEPDEFRLTRGAEDLAVYRFGAREADHFFCRHCGIHTHFFSNYAGKAQYGYNIGCCDDIDPTALPLEWVDGRSF
jgi:hypothetical protein